MCLWYYAAMKIAVVGVSASGKSTFARKLGKKLNHPVTFIDAIMWQPNWQYIGEEETAKKIKAVLEQPSWIIEGYIVKSVRVELFEEADTILYLDYPGWLSAWRYVKRSIKHAKEPRLELPGSPDKFSFKTLKLIYTKGEVYKLEKLFKENEWNDKIVRLKTPAAAKNYLQKL